MDELDVGLPFGPIVWHKALNQILCGGDSGAIKVLYDPELSSKGAVLCAGRAVRRTDDAADWNPGLGVIINPDVQDEEQRKRRKTDVTAKQQRAKMRPDLPVTGTSVGGQVSLPFRSSGVYRSTFSSFNALQVGSSRQHQLLKTVLKLGEYVPEDPRQALLKYDAAAKADPKFIAHAYAETQPEPIFDADALEEYEELERLRKTQAAKPKNQY